MPKICNFTFFSRIIEGIYEAVKSVSIIKKYKEYGKFTAGIFAA